MSEGSIWSFFPPFFLLSLSFLAEICTFLHGNFTCLAKGNTPIIITFVFFVIITGQSLLKYIFADCQFLHCNESLFTLCDRHLFSHSRRLDYSTKFDLKVLVTIQDTHKVILRCLNTYLLCFNYNAIIVIFFIVK